MLHKAFSSSQLQMQNSYRLWEPIGLYGEEKNLRNLSLYLPTSTGSLCPGITAKFLNVSFKFPKFPPFAVLRPAIARMRFCESASIWRMNGSMRRCGFGKVRATPASSLSPRSALESCSTSSQERVKGGGRGFGTNAQQPWVGTSLPVVLVEKSAGCIVMILRYH